MLKDRIFLAVSGTVLALRVQDGAELWRTQLGGFFGSGYVTGVTLLDGRLYATCQGEITCMDPDSGKILWHNGLSGLGTGFISVAGSEPTGPAAAQHAAAASAAAGAAAAAAVMVTTTASS